MQPCQWHPPVTTVTESSPPVLLTLQRHSSWHFKCRKAHLGTFLQLGNFYTPATMVLHFARLFPVKPCRVIEGIQAVYMDVPPSAPAKYSGFNAPGNYSPARLLTLAAPRSPFSLACRQPSTKMRFAAGFSAKNRWQPAANYGCPLGKSALKMDI